MWKVAGVILLYHYAQYDGICVFASGGCLWSASGNCSSGSVEGLCLP